MYLQSGTNSYSKYWNPIYNLFISNLGQAFKVAYFSIVFRVARSLAAAYGFG